MTGLESPQMSTGALTIHNLKVIQSREGWTEADLMQAIADAKAGIRYPMPERHTRFKP